jgi:hypothetical protein
MLKLLLFASFATALVTEIFELAFEHGYLHHAIDLVSNSSPEALVQHWSENGWYMDSFSFLNPDSPKCAGDLGVLLDPKHPSVTAHIIANENLVWNPLKQAIPMQNTKWSAACDNSNFREAERIQSAANDRQMSSKVISKKDI